MSSLVYRVRPEGGNGQEFVHPLVQNTLAKPGSSLPPNLGADCLWAVHSTSFLKFRAQQIYPATPEGC